MRLTGSSSEASPHPEHVEQVRFALTSHPFSGKALGGHLHDLGVSAVLSPLRHGLQHLIAGSVREAHFKTTPTVRCECFDLWDAPRPPASGPLAGRASCGTVLRREQPIGLLLAPHRSSSLVLQVVFLSNCWNVHNVVFRSSRLFDELI